MKKYPVLLILLFFSTFAAWAQRKGSIETGGTIFFNSYSEADEKNTSQLSLESWIGYYLSHDIGIDINPSLNINMHPDSVSISMLILGSFRFRLFDMLPSGYRKMDYLRTDYGISSSIFANIGLGYWSDSYSLTEKLGVQKSGPALMVGLGSQSNFGRFSTLRTKLQYVQMFPSATSKDKGRSLLMVGVGFGVFLR